MKTEDNTLRYDKMVESALRGVVRQAVSEVQKSGLPGDHHFYITFLTEFPGVSIPDYLRERYPGEMTIVLQYQFSDLSVDAEKINVTLSFNNIPEKLVIPLSAVTIFADPSVNFALQFQPLGEMLDGGDEDPEPDDDGTPKSKRGKSMQPPKGDAAKTGEVVSLDQFRKK
jgi:hypothetical protein